MLPCAQLAIDAVDEWHYAENVRRVREASSARNVEGETSETRGTAPDQAPRSMFSVHPGTKE